MTHTGTTDVKHQFTGQEKDDSTGLLYYNARYYDPQLGRFVTADTIVPNASNPQEFNRYSYVNNNPVKYNDPTGHKKRGFWRKFFAIALVGVGGEFILSHPKIARFLGQPVYRAAQAYSAGASWKETLTAAANGAGEVYGALNNPTQLPDLFKGGPRTDSFSSDTRKFLEMSLQSLGLDAVSAKIATYAIEVTLTTGNRSYAAITATATSSGIDQNVKTGISFTFALFSFDYQFRSTLKTIGGFLTGGLAGLGINGGEVNSVDYNPFTAYSASLYAELRTERKGDQEQRSYFGPLGKALSVSGTFVRDQNGVEKIRNPRIEIGGSLGLPAGVTFPVAEKSDQGKWERKF